MAKVLLEARDVRKYFPVTTGRILVHVKGWIRAVDGVSFTISEGETFGLVGESGCGKTTMAKVILLLERMTGGSILFNGRDIGEATAEQLREYRRSVQPVFQDPFSSLSPRMRVGRIVAEPLLANNDLPGMAVADRVAEVLEQVGLTRAGAQLYPHEFSGGQRQRIAIARALVLNPRLIILDEPVSSLDVSIRAQIMNLLRDLQDGTGVTYLLIAHDLAVVKHMSTHIGVMYAGKLVELAGSDELHAHPLHPYTRALLSAALPSHPDEHREEIILAGEVPSPLHQPSGCRFHNRCSQALPVCSETEPVLKSMTGQHDVACHLYS